MAEYKISDDTYYGVDNGREYIKYQRKSKRADEELFVEFRKPDNSLENENIEEHKSGDGIGRATTVHVYRFIKKHNMLNKIREKLGKEPKIEKEDIFLYNASLNIKETAERYLYLEDMQGMDKIVLKAHNLIVEKGRSMAEKDLMQKKIKSVRTKEQEV